MMKRKTLTMNLIAAGVGLLVGSSALAVSHEESDQAGQAQMENRSNEQSIASAEQQSDTQQSQDLQQLADEHSDLSTFVTALEEAGLAEALTQGTTYTVFAPTNDAFDSMEEGSVDELLKPENHDQLVSLLRAHIVADDVDPQMAEKISEAKTIDGGTVALQSQEGTLQIGDASVLQDDIQQGSLRVYAIDKVLSPSSTAQVASSGMGEESSSETSATGESSSTGTETAQVSTDADTATGAATTASADFDQLDQDGDGYLSETELQQSAAGEVAQQQTQLDTDSDGRLSRTEFAAFESSETGSTTESTGSATESTTEGMTEESSIEQSETSTEEETEY